MTQDLAINLIAAFIAFLLGLVVRAAWSKRNVTKEERQLAKVHAQMSPAFTQQWLIEYYLRNGALGDLVLVEANGQRTFVPVLTRPEWQFAVSADSEIIDQSTPLAGSDVQVNTRIVESRRKFIADDPQVGGLWDDNLVRVDFVDSQLVGPPRITVGVCRYFQYLTACGELEEETFAAVRNQSRTTPLRDNAVPNATTAAECILGAHGLGMQVSFVLRLDDEYWVLVQQRSRTVATYGGAQAVVPVFAVQTVDLSENSEVDLKHNFLRELYEELLGGDEVNRPGARLDPRWFYEEKRVQQLMELEQTGSFSFTILGLCFDALNGEANLAGLALLEDGEFAKELVRDMRGNWEMDHVHIERLDSSELSRLMVAGEFQPGSAFSLLRAREYLATQ